MHLLWLFLCFSGEAECHGRDPHRWQKCVVSWRYGIYFVIFVLAFCLTLTMGNLFKFKLIKNLQFGCFIHPPKWILKCNITYRKECIIITDQWIFTGHTQTVLAQEILYPKKWNTTIVLTFLFSFSFFAMLGIKPRASWMPDKCSTTELHFLPHYSVP